MKRSYFSRPHLKQLECSADFHRKIGYDCKLGRGKLTIIAPPSPTIVKKQKESQNAHA